MAHEGGRRGHMMGDRWVVPGGDGDPANPHRAPGDATGGREALLPDWT